MKRLFVKLICAVIPSKELRKVVRVKFGVKKLHKGNKVVDEADISQRYKNALGRELNLENPKLFTEKLQWMKFNYFHPKMADYSDKYKVRAELEKKGYSDYLTKLYQTCDKPEDIKWDSLPDRFVIKTTHDSGGVWVVKNKKDINKFLINSEIRDHLDTIFGLSSAEFHYCRIKPRIIIEELLECSSGDLKDYKLFCFNGKVEYIQVDFDRFTDHTRTFYDVEWNNMKFSSYYPIAQKDLDKPVNLDEMIKIAEDLSLEFPHLRVDLYNVNGKIYFGECTFFHGSGFEKFEPEEWDRTMGDLIKI